MRVRGRDLGREDEGERGGTWVGGMRVRGRDLCRGDEDERGDQGRGDEGERGTWVGVMRNLG